MRAAATNLAALEGKIGGLVGLAALTANALRTVDGRGLVPEDMIALLATHGNYGFPPPSLASIFRRAFSHSGAELRDHASGDRTDLALADHLAVDRAHADDLGRSAGEKNFVGGEQVF